MYSLLDILGILQFLGGKCENNLVCFILSYYIFEKFLGTAYVVCLVYSF